MKCSYVRWNCSKVATSILFILLATCKLSAQVAPNFNSSYSGSSNSTETGKKINIPVNYFTGIPAINLPIYGYNKGGLEVNVSLDYMAGGVKVEEKGTSVGLGWSLTAGGVITRSMKGLPDDCPGRGFMFTPEVEPGNTSTPRGNTTLFSYANYGTDSIDSEIDVFQFNAGGRAGSFIIGKDKKAVLIPQQNTKVTWNTGALNGVSLSSISSFTITFEDGVKYIFSIPEITTRTKLSDYDRSKGYVSAWHLKSIISAFGEDTINFEYKNVTTTKYVDFPGTRFDRDGEPSQLTRAGDTFITDEKYLSSIRFPYSYRLDFIYNGTERKDLPGAYSLQRIELRDSIMRKGYQFEYRYFLTTGGSIDSSSNSTAISKLQLYRLYEYTQFGKLPSYEFTYSLHPVPKSTSASQDHWGYFNNRVNTDLVPALGTLSGANREPDAEYSKSGLLTAIRYPQGGKNEFEYEANDRTNYFFQEKKQLIFNNSTNQLNASFTVNKATGIPSAVQISVNYPYDGGCTVILTLKNASGTIIDQFQPATASGASTVRNYNLNTGSYNLSSTPVSSCGSTYIPRCVISWLNDTGDSSYSLMGGVRIKKITTRDSLGGNPPTVREFKYIRENGTSSGFCFYKPVYDYAFNLYSRTGSTTTYTTRVGSAMNNLDYILGTPVGYSRVEELMPGNGKTVYEFSSYKDMNFYPTPPQFPFAVKFFPVWELGQLKKATVLNESGKVLKITENKYTFYVQEFTDSAFKSIKFNASYQNFGNGGTLLGTGYATDTYSAISGRAELDSTIEKMVYGSDTTATTTQYLYDSFFNPYITRSWLTKDRSRCEEVRSYYPYNYTLGGPIQQLKDNSIIAPVCKETWLKTPTGDFLKDAILYGYELINGKGIRPKYIYKLFSSKPVPLSQIGSFDGTVLNRKPSLIRLSSTIDQFDSRLNPLQTTDNISGVKESSIWDDEFQTSIATVKDASLNEIAYTSFEGAGTGNWSIPAGSYHYSDAMTGRRSFVLNGNISVSVPAGKKYIVTFWAKSGTFSVNGSQPTKLVAHRGWSLYQQILPENTSSIAVSGSNLIIDELRAFPLNATMKTNTVEFIGGITSTCDEGNRIQYIEYDYFGRKVLVRDENRNIIEMNCYGDAGQTVNCNIIYKNNEVSRRFTQSNCTTSQTPDTLLYTVNAGKYSSTRSQYEADSLAWAELQISGPANANANGTCGRIYARVSYENATTYAADVWVKFYADEACTRPREVKDIMVTLRIEDICGYTNSFSQKVSGSSALLIPMASTSYETSDCDPGVPPPCFYHICYINYYLQPGVYIVK